MRKRIGISKFSHLKRFFQRKSWFLAAFFLIFSLLASPLYFHPQKKPDGILDLGRSFTPPTAMANNQYYPTGGTLVTGTEQTITSATAANAEGVNIGSWKGTMGDDDFHWVIGSTASGYDLNLTVGGVRLQGANMLMIQTQIDLDATAPATLFQICDWSDSTGVDAAADDQCTNGGWRTLNLNKATVAPTTASNYHYQIYDGYWSDGANTPRSTPLTNFVNGSSQIKIRYYSNTNTTTTVAIDFLRVYAVINPIYTPSDFTNNNPAGSVTGDYTATVLGSGQLGSDDVFNGAGGDASSPADFYWSFRNIKTYTGMNTILVRSEYECSGVGINHRPRIYNFSTSSWEDLTTGNIACTVSDNTNAWAKNNINLSDYISSGEIRVGFYGLSNGTQIIRADFISIMLGTTNTDVSACEISFGTNALNDCSSTRDLDMTAASPSTWQINTEDESATFSHAFYPTDHDSDGTLEEAAASHVKFSVTQPPNTSVTGAFFASRHMSGAAGTVTASLRDYSGFTSTTGGFTDLSGTGTTALTYTDNTSIAGVGNGVMAGLITNPWTYLDTTNNQMWMRLRTSTDGATTNNSVNQWDFAMVSLQWVEDSTHPSTSYQFTPISNTLLTGTEQDINSRDASANEGMNTGNWKGTLADDAYHWMFASTASGYDANLTVGGIRLNGANALLIQTEIDEDATAPATLFQICDWVSSAGVDAATDAQCSGGGWRTLNLNKTAVAPTVYTIYHYQIYDGYFSSGTNTPLSTPLANFVNGSNQIKIRYYSTTNTTTTVAIDFLRISPVVAPLYTPSGFTNLGGGVATGDYMSAQSSFWQAPGSSYGIAGSDNVYNGAAGTAGSVADMYWSFKNVEIYPGMNALVVRAETGCLSAGGTNYRPKIYNFTSAVWEDLTAGGIVCSATDGSNQWAKSGISMADYIDESNDNEMRIGLYGLTNNTNTIRADYIYLMLGSVNTDTADCEISFGSGAASGCSNTRDLDSTGTYNFWDITPEDESASFSHDYYTYDNNGDGSLDAAAAGHIKFSPTLPSGKGLASIYFSLGYLAGVGYSSTNSGAVIGNIRDYSGFTGNIGGFTPTGATANITLNYSDNITISSFGSGGIAGIYTNPDDYLDTQNNQIWLRVRTSSTLSGPNMKNQGSNLPVKVDYAMVSLAWIDSVTNSSPAVPTNLGPAGYIDAAGWMNDNTPAFSFDLSDPDAGQQVQYRIQIDDTAGFGSPVVDYTSALGSQGSYSFTVGQAAGGGSYIAGNEGMSLNDSAADGGYFWRVKAIDAAAVESSYEEAGVDNTIDFRADSTAPTGGTVYDGLAGDQDWNDGSLTSISGNWTGFDASNSGLLRYEYAIRRQSDGYYWDGNSWENGQTWTDNGTNTSFTNNSVELQTGVVFYISVRAVDNAGNTSGPTDSNGQQVLPTLSFSLSTNQINFSNLNNGNDWTDSKQLTASTSTNASNGYTIKVYNTAPLTSTANPSETVTDFTGTWVAPLAWPAGQYGFGYTSNDPSVQGVDRFNAASQYAAFSQTIPGDVVADHTDPVTGTTGAVVNEEFTITYKVTVPQTQSASTYQTSSIYLVTANY